MYQADGVSVDAIAKVKDAGNTAYKAGDPDSLVVAVQKYTKALRYVTFKRENESGADGDDGNSSELTNLEATCLLNRAQACLKLGGDKRKTAFTDTSQVLKLQGVSPAQMVKAYYRRSQATTDDEAREQDLRDALKLDPKNAACRRDLDALKKKYAAQKEAQRKAYSKMFS